MKKILTASLVAMMAVTAANADIASTKYVSDQTGSDKAFVAGDFKGAASSATNLKGAVNAIADAVAGLSGDGTGSVSEQISTALSGATADKFSTSVQASLTKADTAVQKGDVTIGTTNGTIKVQGTEVSVAGLKSAAYQEASAFDSAGAADQALEDAKDYTDAEIGGLSTNFSNINTSISALQQTVGQNKTEATEAAAQALTDAKADAQSKADAALAEAKTYADTAEADAVAAAKTAGDAAYAAKSYEARVQTNETAISKINIATAQTLAAGQGDGQYALTMTKSGDTLTYKWEMIDRN